MNARVFWVSFSISIFITGISKGEDYRRLEVFASYEQLSPRLYGERKTGTFTFVHRPFQNFTYSISLSGFSRKEGNAILASIGIYKDWTDRLYTYTALSHGTNSLYLPKFRFDEEVYLKFGKSKNVVPTVGFSYIKYYDVHKDNIISIGLIYYGAGWNITYKHSINRSDPGNVGSSSNLISIGIGREKSSWTYIDFSYGKQAYLATHITLPTEVRQNSLRIGLNHRRWIANSLGIVLNVDYFKLEKGYEKYGFGCGLFKEF